MTETPYNHYALYEPDASPDLTATGEYNSAIMDIDADIHVERIDRETADNRLQAALADESQERKDADDRLDERIDNAEGEISANSADLTGIKSLTYGSEHVQFLEHDNGSYSSPALDEIDEQINALTSAGITVMKLSEFGALDYNDNRPYSASGEGDAAAYNKLKQAWPNVVVVDGSTTWAGGMFTPANWTQLGYTLTKSSIDSTEHGTPVSMTVGGSGYSNAVTLKEITLPVASANTLGGVKIPSEDDYPLGVNANGELYFSQFIPSRIQIQHTLHEYANLNLKTGALIFKDPAFSVEAIDNYGSVAVGLNLPDSGITPDTQWGTIEA